MCVSEGGEKNTWGVYALMSVAVTLQTPVSLLMSKAELREELYVVLIPKLFDISSWDCCWVFRCFYHYQF